MADVNPFLKYTTGAGASGDDNPFQKYAKAKPKGAVSPALESARKEVGNYGPFDEFFQSTTQGFGKDIDATAARGITAVKNLVHKAKGEDEPYTSQESAEATKQAEREGRAKFEKNHPHMKWVPEIAGALFTPGVGELSAALKGAPPLLRAMGVGALVGGAGGVGESEGSLKDRAGHFIPGALAGAATSGALHGVLHPGEFVKGTMNAADEMVSRFARGLSSRDPAELSANEMKRGEKYGLEQVRKMVAKLDPTMTKLKDNAAEKAGIGITSAEALGREAETFLKAAGRRAGTTADALDARLSQRREESSSVIRNHFAKALGLDAEKVAGDLSTITEGMRARAKPLYEAFFGTPEPLRSPELSKILRTPAAQEALAIAEEIAGNEHEDAYSLGIPQAKSELPHYVKGPNDSVPRLLTKEDGSPRMVPRGYALHTAQEQGFEHPHVNDAEGGVTARGWDYIKRGLDETLEKYRDRITKRIDMGQRGVKQIMNLRKELAHALTDESKPWGAAAKRAFEAGGDPIKLESAFHDAKNLFSNTVTKSQFDERLKSMRPEDREIAIHGMVKHIADVAASGRETRAVSQLLTPVAKEKLATLMGDDGRAEELIRLMKLQHAAAKSGARIAPPSGYDSAQALLGAGEQTAAGFGHALRSLGAGHPGALVGHLLTAPFIGAYRGLQAPMEEGARNVAGELLQMNPSELAARLEKVAKDEAARMNKPGIGKAVRDTYKIARTAAQRRGTLRHPGVNAGAAGMAGRHVMGDPTGGDVQVGNDREKQFRLPDGTLITVPIAPE